MIHNAGGKHSVPQIKAGWSREDAAVILSAEVRTSAAPAEIGTNLFYEAAS